MSRHALTSGAAALALAAAVCLGRASVAYAQDGNAPEDAATQTARQHMERGQELFLSDRFADAADEFQRAFDARPFSAFLFNAGVACEKAEAFSRAADFFSRYLDLDPEASDRDRVRSRVERLRTRALDQMQQQGLGVTPDAGTPPPDVDGGGVATDVDAGVPPPAVDAGAPPPVLDAGVVVQTQPLRHQYTAEERNQLLAEFRCVFELVTDPAGADVTLMRGDTVVAHGQSPLIATLAPGQYRLRIEHPQFNRFEREIDTIVGILNRYVVPLAQDRPPGFFQVFTTPPGARVFVDRRDRGAIRTPVNGNTLPEGDHRLWIDAPGYETIERTIHVRFGGLASLDLTLERVAYGMIGVDSGTVRGAEVFVDDHLVGQTPLAGARASPGEHEVRVEGDGMKSWEGTVHVTRGQLTPVTVHFQPAPGRGGAVVTAVLGTLVLSGGAVAGILANRRADELAQLRDEGRLASNDSRITEGFFLSIGADIAFGVGALLGLYSLWQFVRSPGPDSTGREEAPHDWSANVDVGPHGGSASLRWSF